MKLSLGGKVILLVVVAVILISSGCFLSTYLLTIRGSDENMRREVGRVAEAVQIQLDSTAAKMSIAAQATASRPDVAQAIEKVDSAYLQKIGKEIMQKTGSEFITFVDRQGKVVARGHSDKTGDIILNQTNVQKSLAGEASTGIDEGTVVKYSLRAGAPIKSGDGVVGVVSTGIELSSNRFVDEIKRLFGVECNILLKDTWVATTLTKDGQRAVGMKTDNPAILQSVLQRGERFQDEGKIMGHTYQTAYWPLKNAEGKTSGILFIGMDKEQLFKTTRNIIMTILAVVLVLGSVLVIAGILTARSITRPIMHFSHSLKEAADQVSSASVQFTAASQSLAEGASEQAAALEETSSSLEEMSSMTKQNADNAASADILVKQSNQMVDQANISMTELMHSMEQISSASEQTSKIIKTIDEIAFQTNLLALNAAVEAARAGDAGAGFAVVANEVRSLAIRAADAARNTSILIEGTKTKVNGGSDLVHRTNEAFAEVAKSAAKLGSLVSEIAAASCEQAQGIDQINKAIAEMDRVTQQNAANAEESASVSEAMSGQVEQMRQVAFELTTIITGSHGKSNHTELRNRSALRSTADNVRAALPVPKGTKVPTGKAKFVNPNQIIPMDKDEFLPL